MTLFLIIFFFNFTQKSEDADYNKFLDTLVNRRRQVADSNPKTLAPSILAHSASGSSIGSADFRPTKSIIVGGGQPIVIPGQHNITNDVRATRKPLAAEQIPSSIAAAQPEPSAIPVVAKATQGFIASLFGKSDVQEAAVAPPTSVTRMTINEQRIVSVEEFCPDGEVLDKGFLLDDDHQGGGGAAAGQIDADSDR